MFEKYHQSLVSKTFFYLRLTRAVFFGLLSIAIAQFIGMWGYRHFENMPWSDAFVNAAMILSDMGYSINP